MEDTVDADAVELRPCKKCPLGFPKSGYSDSAWQRRDRDQGAVCLKCEAKEKKLAGRRVPREEAECSLFLIHVAPQAISRSVGGLPALRRRA